MAAVTVLGLIVMMRFLPARLDAEYTALVERALEDEAPGGVFINGGKELSPWLVKGDNDSTVLVIGDSHAGQYYPRFDSLARVSAGEFPTVKFLTYGGCPPYPGVNHIGISWDGSPFRCPTVHSIQLRAAMSPEVRTVVYSAYWEAYLEQKALYFADDPSKQPIPPAGAFADSMFALLSRELEAIRRSGKTVYLILSNPTSPLYDPLKMLPDRLSGGRTLRAVTAVDRNTAVLNRRFIEQKLRQIAAEVGAKIIDPFDYLCDKASCKTVNASGVPIYRDEHHLRATYVRAHAYYVDRIVGDITSGNPKQP